MAFVAELWPILRPSPSIHCGDGVCALAFLPQTNDRKVQAQREKRKDELTLKSVDPLPTVRDHVALVLPRRSVSHRFASLFQPVYLSRPPCVADVECTFAPRAVSVGSTPRVGWRTAQLVFVCTVCLFVWRLCTVNPSALVTVRSVLLFQDTRMYQAIGKMFLMKPKESIEKRLVDNIAAYENTIAVCCCGRPNGVCSRCPQQC